MKANILSNFNYFLCVGFVGKLLEAKRPNLYWTPCAVHCLDLMLEDIGKQVPKVKSALKKSIFAIGYI